MENLLQVENISKQYQDFTLDRISFSLPRGYIMGLIGPNGAGKTTIIKLIMNLIHRDSGAIHIFGQDNIAAEAEIKQRIGFVYDNPAFLFDVRLVEIKNAIARLYLQWDEACFKKTAAEFELPMRKKFKELSEGVKTKFALCLALSHGAELIILDEPTAGLDPIFRRELLERLSSLIAEERTSILFSTHITSDLERIADFITFINEGELLFSCSKDDILNQYGIVKGGLDLLNDSLLPFYKSVRKTAFGVQALTNDRKSAQQRVQGQGLVEKASLDDIMVFMNNGGAHASQNHAA